MSQLTVFITERSLYSASSPAATIDYNLSNYNNFSIRNLTPFESELPTKFSRTEILPSISLSYTI